MNNVFILKTDSDSADFKKKLNKFLSKHCKDTDSNAAIFELNETAKRKAIEIIKN
ncbi:hypothetical protein [Schinkia azotoformans]|uniref:hypothetical protein n=1 Tax=Schinkia azotoformans TaxID=1454 RepID=UPI002DB87941|nr:hypothetical protein [Schinkia azotoformans]MEC1744144.1 hypothetical protein [Schinkia azotoformans]